MKTRYGFFLALVCCLCARPGITQAAYQDQSFVLALEDPTPEKEEDAVDGFGVFMSTLWEMDDLVLANAMLFDAYALNEGEDLSEEQFMDSHSLDKQRMYSMLCMIYGSNPDAYQEIIEEIDMDEETVELCIVDYEGLYAWKQVPPSNTRRCCAGRLRTFMGISRE